MTRAALALLLLLTGCATPPKVYPPVTPWYGCLDRFFAIYFVGDREEPLCLCGNGDPCPAAEAEPWKAPK